MNDFYITFPLLAGKKQAAGFPCICHDLQSLETLQAKFGDGPDEIKIQVLLALKEVDL